MKIESLNLDKIRVGEVLLGRNLWPQGQPQLRLVIVESEAGNLINLAPFCALFADDEALEGDEDWLQKSVERAAAPRFLAHPILEIGDLLRHRDRPCAISETRSNDWHVRIRYSDSDGGEFYGNLLWMDIYPTLNLVDLNAAWPAFP